MKISLLFLSLLIFLVSFHPAKDKESIHNSVKAETDRIYDDLISIRRELHKNTELAGHEVKTQAFIKQYLLNLGLQVETGIYGKSVVGILNGNKKGKKIAWRADMDALPNDFQDQAGFRSAIKGVGHGCGHDVHMAIALGIANVLSKNKASLKGTVYFIFQPEEETFRGASGMLSNGLLSLIRPDEIYGLHVTALPAGQIMVKPNEIFAYQKRLKITLKNELSNAQATELGRTISKALARAQKNSKPWEIQHIADPISGISNPNTIFKNYLVIDQQFSIHSEKDQLIMEAYLYETESSNLPLIIPKVKQAIEQNGFSSQLQSVIFTQENPTVLNDLNLSNAAVETIRRIYGDNSVSADYGQVPFFNDDFAYFQQQIPGVYFLLGGSNPEKGMIAMNHAPNFAVDEECIRTGVRNFSSLIIERAGQQHN